MRKIIVLLCVTLTLCSGLFAAKKIEVPEDVLAVADTTQVKKYSVFDGENNWDPAVLKVNGKKYYLPYAKKTKLASYTYHKFDASYLYKYFDKETQKICKKIDFLVVEGRSDFNINYSENMPSTWYFFGKENFPSVIIISEKLQDEYLVKSEKITVNKFNILLIEEMAAIVNKYNNDSDKRDYKWKIEYNNMLTSLIGSEKTKLLESELARKKEGVQINKISINKDSFDISSDKTLKVVIQGKNLDYISDGNEFYLAKHWNNKVNKYKYKKNSREIKYFITDSKFNSCSKTYTISEKDISNSESISMDLPVPEKVGNYFVYVSFFGGACEQIPFKVKGNVIFTASDIPNIFETPKEESIITARIKGCGFTDDKTFTVSCPEYSEINEKAKISVIDFETLKISFPVPKKEGKYNLTVSCDSNDFSQSFNVLKSDKVYFGKWPQTIAKTGIKFTETNKTFGETPIYKGNDGKEYVKVIANPYEDYSFSDGTKIENEKEYYFMLEPIEWKILNIDDEGNYTVCSSKILTSNVPYFNSNKVRKLKNKSDIYPSNYKYSNVRAYLNGIINPYSLDGNTNDVSSINWSDKGFLQLAFTQDEQSKILVTEVDNSASSTTDITENILTATIEKRIDFRGNYYESGKKFITDNTEDKIFLLSEKEVTSGFFSSHNILTSQKYELNEDRQVKPTDFALASHCWMSTEQNGCTYLGYGWWWLRSPKAFLNDRARGVQAAGDPYYYFHTDYTMLGIVPAMRISAIK